MNELFVIYIVVFLLFMGVLFIGWQTISLRKRLEYLFGKNKKESIEIILNKYVKGIKKYYDDVEELKSFSEKLFKMASLSLQKTGLVRYNPFGDVGGDQSFSAALLNFKNSGVIITSLYSRDGTRVYSKEVKDGKSANHLSDEEKEALGKAIKDYKKGD